MTERDYRNLLNNRFQRLQLITENIAEFEEELGKSGLRDLIDETLDEINYLREKLKDFDDQK